jgi:hypothetical protein
MMMKKRRAGLAVGRTAWVLAAAGAIGAVCGSASGQSVARQWDDQLISAIRLDKPRPPVHARNLYHTSVCMWDAWAAYDTQADQVIHHERATPPMGLTVEQAREQAISQAAYRMIKHRYQAPAVGAATTLANINAKLTQLGLDPSFTGTTGDSPAALGNRIFEHVRDVGLMDGSNEPGNYGAPAYVPVNAPLILAFDGTTMANPNRWQPLAFDWFINQNGIPEGAITQAFVCPHWDAVTPFGLRRTDPNNVYMDPGGPPMLGGASDAQFKSEFEQVIAMSAQLDPTDNVMVDIGLNVTHNNPLGTNDGHGYPVNPVTGQPYPSNVVKRGDYARVLAEFWADGPNSETPPGHWNVIANMVSDNPLVVKRIGGAGPLCGDLEWDVKTYLAINGAVHDAAIVAWGLKGKYDSVRPISAIRFMGQTGQSSDPMQPSYNAQGLPLIPGLVELVTNETIQPGQRHANIPERDEGGEIIRDHVGEVVIRSWLQQPADPVHQIGGVGWMLAKHWKPYQKNTFVTPPFAGYSSGHSTFSRSAAEVMTGITGTPFFPGGFATYSFPQNAYLSFEQGPSQNLVLEWATYYDAADEAGISRLYGGIHIAADDFSGRINGSRVGKTALEVAKRYFQGRVSCPGNWNGVNGVSIQDLFDFLADYFAGNADMNLDGTTSVQDIFDFLMAWFAGCA